MLWLWTKYYKKNLLVHRQIHLHDLTLNLELEGTLATYREELSFPKEVAEKIEMTVTTICYWFLQVLQRISWWISCSPSHTKLNSRNTSARCLDFKSPPALVFCWRRHAAKNVNFAQSQCGRAKTWTKRPEAHSQVPHWSAPGVPKP